MRTGLKIIIYLFFFCFNIKEVLATICYDSRDPETCVGTWLINPVYVDQSNCDPPEPSICAKGDVCPYTTCGFTDNGCCSEAQSWTAYETACVRSDDGLFGYLHTIVYIEITTNVYSIGDKQDSVSSLVFDSSSCAGQAISPYKACCNTSTGTLIPYSTIDSDGHSPLEAYCASGTVISATTDAQAYETCRQYNPCQNECFTSGGTCSSLNNTSFTYSNGTGLCSSGQICCIKTAVVNPEPVCNTPTDPICNDNSECTTDSCANPGTLSAQCVYTPNGLCDTFSLYYCQTSSGTCTSTSNTYTRNSSGISQCQNNLATYYPGETTGVCYIESSDCSAACITGTPSCVPYNCTTINGACGSSDGSTYTSSETPSNLCSSGTATGLSNSYGYWSWTCEGSSK